MDNNLPTFVVVGGGIAGVSCAETLRTYRPDANVTIVSASPLIKAVRNVKELTRSLATFDVQETSIKDYEHLNPKIKVIHEEVQRIDVERRAVKTRGGVDISYDKLCVCSGAKPKSPFPLSNRILSIRDTASATELESKLHTARRVMVVGNGGIATELVFQIRNCEVVWTVKDKSIGHVFFDCGAAEFFLPLMNSKGENDGDEDGDKPKVYVKRMNYAMNEDSESSTAPSKLTGGALGPDWHRSLHLHGSSDRSNKIVVEYECEVDTFDESNEYKTEQPNSDEWPLRVKLTNGKTYGCDFIICATGVTSNIDIFPLEHCKILPDDGVEIDCNMRIVGLKHEYAAGDVCSTMNWPYAQHWHQMRLWTQARQMGAFAAQCMVNDTCSDSDDLPLDICFDLFAHATNFFGKKVVLLGRYNMQGLEAKEGLELLVRATRDEEYIKVVLLDGRMCGAVLVGETDLEETFENLILNGTDLAFLGEELLNPEIDIADYFD